MNELRITLPKKLITDILAVESGEKPVEQLEINNIDMLIEFMQANKEALDQSLKNLYAARKVANVMVQTHGNSYQPSVDAAEITIRTLVRSKEHFNQAIHRLDDLKRALIAKAADKIKPKTEAQKHADNLETMLASTPMHPELRSAVEWQIANLRKQ